MLIVWQISSYALPSLTSSPPDAAAGTEVSTKTLLLSLALCLVAVGGLH